MNLTLDEVDIVIELLLKLLTLLIVYDVLMDVVFNYDERQENVVDSRGLENVKLLWLVLVLSTFFFSFQEEMLGN